MLGGASLDTSATTLGEVNIHNMQNQIDKQESEPQRKPCKMDDRRSSQRAETNKSLAIRGFSVDFWAIFSNQHHFETFSLFPNLGRS